MNRDRSNNQNDFCIIEESLKLGEDYGEDPSNYDFLNQVLADSFNRQLYSPYFPERPPTYLNPTYTPVPQYTAQQPQITLNTQPPQMVSPSQPIANEDANYHLDDDRLNIQENEEMHQLNSTQNSVVHEPIPIQPPHPTITIFQMLKKNQLRNSYNLSSRQTHKSLDNPKNLRKLKKICSRYAKRFGDQTITASEIRLLDINKRNLTIQSGQVASYFYVEGADYRKNLMRYIYGKYFIWYGRNRYALDVLRNKRIQANKRAIYYQTMSTFVQQVPHILQIFQHQYNNILGNVPQE